MNRGFVIVIGMLLVLLIVSSVLAAEPPGSFTAAGNTYTKAGSSTTRVTTWMPVALIAAPPFERVIPRARVRDEDLVPLSIIPEDVYASFTQGSGEAGSSSTGMYARVSAAFGIKGGVPSVSEASFKAGLEAALEASCGTSWEVAISSTGTNGGINWLLTDDVLVFAVRSSYTAYTYSAPGVPGKVELYMPQDGSHTARLFDLAGWNAYATAKNDAGEYLRDLPTFYSERPLTGNVDQYPSLTKGYYPVNAGDRFRGTPTFRMVGSKFYIDHHGSGLSGGMTISSGTFASSSASIGATLQFEGQSGVATASVEAALGATFTHEFSTSRSINMNFKTSSVHEKLDGSTSKNMDYHFTLQPRLYSLAINRSADADFSRMLARRLSFRLQGAAIKGATRATHITGNETNLVKAGANGQLLFAPTGQPLATILSANGVQNVWDSNVLVFDFVVPEKGVSYGRGVPIMPLVQTLVANGVLVPTPTQPNHDLWASLQGLTLPNPTSLVYVGPGSGSNAQIEAWKQQLAKLNTLVYCGPKPGNLTGGNREPLTAFNPSLNDWVLMQPPKTSMVMVNPQLFNPKSRPTKASNGPWLGLPLIAADVTQR